MTRANINFVWQGKRGKKQTLYHNHNGDQYPQGIRDVYNVLSFINQERWTVNGFRQWLFTNYEIGDDHRILPHSAIYEDASGIPMDYSYVFDSTDGKKCVQVYKWDEKIFDGDADTFVSWLAQQ